VRRASRIRARADVRRVVVGSLLVAGVSTLVAVLVATGLYLIAALETAIIRRTTPAAEATGGRSGVRVMAVGIAALGRNVEAARIAGWSSVRSLLRGVWTSLGVIAALQVLGMGESGFGILMMAAGVGTIAAIPLTLALVGRAGLAGPLAAALALCGMALAGVGVIANAQGRHRDHPSGRAR
jgi:hypothetical protein